MNTNITYILRKEKGAKSKGYSNVKYPKHYSLPAIAYVSVYDEEQQSYVRRTIRHCKGEASIFLEKQSKDSKPSKEEITFRDGCLVVNPQTNPTTASYIAMLDSNGAKPNRDASYPIRFIKYDLEEKFKEAIEVEQEKASVMMEFMELSISKKQALAHFMGRRIAGKKESVWVFEMFKAVSANKASIAKFLDDIQDPTLDKVAIISQAETLELLSFKDFCWKFHGSEVIKVDRTQNPYKELAEFLSQNPETWLNLQSSVTKTQNKLAGIKEKPVPEPKSNEPLTGEELLQMGKDSNVIKYKAGVGFLVVDTHENIGRTKAEAAENIANMPELIELITQ
jgi:hypothetical protein